MLLEMKTKTHAENGRAIVVRSGVLGAASGAAGWIVMFVLKTAGFYPELSQLMGFMAGAALFGVGFRSLWATPDGRS